MLKSEFIIQTVLNALETLTSENDLSPRNPVINKTLSHLVHTLASTYEYSEETAALKDPRIRQARPHLLEKLSKAEAEMEKYWADYFGEKETIGIEDLKEFWYWDNYEELVDRELDNFPKDATDHSIAFIGSGALPLTAIIMHLKTGCPVTCVDSDYDACEKSQALIDKLGLENVHVLHAEGNAPRYNSFSTVIIASLIPQDQKDEIVGKLKQDKSSVYVAVRSAERLHSLLYEPVNTEKQFSELDYLGKTKQDSSVINTTLVFSNKSSVQQEIGPQRTHRFESKQAEIRPLYLANRTPNIS